MHVIYKNHFNILTLDGLKAMALIEKKILQLHD